MSSSGGLADTFFLFQLLGIPFTLTNVIIYMVICFIVFIGIVGACALTK